MFGCQQSKLNYGALCHTGGWHEQICDMHASVNGCERRQLVCHVAIVMGIRTLLNRSFTADLLE